MSESPRLFRGRNHALRVREFLNSATFSLDDGSAGLAQEEALRWDIVLPTLLDVADDSATQYTTAMTAWLGPRKVAEVRLEYWNNFDSFAITFFAEDDFTYLRVLSRSAPTTVVVLRSKSGSGHVILDPETHEVIGGDLAEHELSVFLRPARQVQLDTSAIHVGLETLANDAQLAVFQSSGSANQRCENNRKAGWLAAVAVTVGAALAIPTGGSTLVAVAGFASAGALGGATAATVENNAKDCMDDVKQKEQEEKKKEKGK